MTLFQLSPSNCTQTLKIARTPATTLDKAQVEKKRYDPLNKKETLNTHKLRYVRRLKTNAPLESGCIALHCGTCRKYTSCKTDLFDVYRLSNNPWQTATSVGFNGM